MSAPRKLPPVSAVLAVLAAQLAAGCAAAGAPGGKIAAVGAENEYANVIAQVGGRYVHVTAIESNPNTDPHSFEASPSVANEVSTAQLIVQNGLGYDGYMNRIEAATAGPSRAIINAQHLLGLSDATTNPHLWYQPATMPAVARAIASQLSKIDPRHVSYYRAKAASFISSLWPWVDAIDRFRARYARTPVASTEPVGNYLLEAAGTDNLMPFAFQADVMNGVDPAPQNVTLARQLLSQHRVKVLLYNQQVTDSLTQSLLREARNARIPVVGLYETMPGGHDYQSWMLAEVDALEAAVARGTSTEKL